MEGAWTTGLCTSLPEVVYANAFRGRTGKTSNRSELGVKTLRNEGQLVP